jgi:hypothetical protein
MPTIDPTLVPSINPGSLFSRFTTDTSINIRWFVPVDPVTNTVLNRPIADVALRQLILAKTMDALNLRLGHQALFPFLTTAQLNSGTQNVDIPPSWVWDMQVSLPQKWERVRLSIIKRLSGVNIDTTNTEYTGLLRLIFTAQEQGSTSEVAVFFADYQIDSTLTYQIARIKIPPLGSEPLVLSPGESETVGGFITFRTLDTTDIGTQAMLTIVSPALDPTNVDSGGFYLNPTVIETNDSLPGGSGVTGDFDFSAVSHGTGLLTLSAWNPVPSVDSTIATWINTFNYPFDSDASLQSTGATSVIIPIGLFKEFNISAPAGDEPTGDTSGAYFPVWINRIVRIDPSADLLKVWFATFNVNAPSLVPIEFATLDLTRTDMADTILSIFPVENLFPSAAGDEYFQQGFGKGHVKLSDLWGATSTAIDDFFDSFLPIINEPPQATFTKESTRLSSFGISRAPQTTPTFGQAAALRGSRGDAVPPTEDNRYVVELDQGLGFQIDFATHSDLPDERKNNTDIERFGYTGSLAHRIVQLIVRTDGEDHDYDLDILPRLRILLGRDPTFGDFWWDGTILKFFNGSIWIG